MARIDVRALRREQILDAAERLVAERGWADTTFAELCREANISNGVLTHAFESKKEMLLALWERLAGRRTAQLADLLAQSVSVPEVARQMVQSCAEKGQSERRLLLLVLHYLSEAAADPALAEQLRAHFAHNRDLAAARLREEQAKGSVRADLDVEVAAALIQWLSIGIGLGTLTGAIDRRAIDAIDELLQRYLQPVERSAPPE